MVSLKKDGVLQFTAGWHGAGLRAWKETVGSPRVYFLYDDEDRLIAEVQADGTVVASYDHGPAGLIHRRTPLIGGGQFHMYFMFDPFGHPSWRFDHAVSSGGGSTQNQIDRAYIYDARGMKFGEVSANGGEMFLPPDDPVGAGGQWGAWTEIETESVVNAGISLSGNRYYDPVACRHLTEDERYGNKYSDGDDGRAVMEWFQVLGMLPGTSAVIQMVYAYDAIGEGRWGAAGGHLVGVAANAVGGAAILSSIRSAAALSRGFAGRLGGLEAIATAQARTMQAARVAGLQRKIKGLQVRINNLKGAMAERNALNALDALLDAGYTLRQGRQYTRIKGFSRGRYYDGKVYDPNGRLVANVEVKSGGAQYGGIQQQKDIASQGQPGGVPTWVIYW